MDYATARHNMVDGQLRPNRINQPEVLAQMAALPREQFARANTPAPYADAPLELTPTRSMPSPLLAAHLAQSLQLEGHEKVTVINGGTGYLAAVLAGLAKQVTLVEPDSALRKQAQQVLAELKMTNITVQAQLPQGHGADALLVETPQQHLAPEWLHQVKDGGRLACLLQTEQGLTQAVSATRHGNTLFNTTCFETQTLPLAAPATETFRF